MTCCMLIDVCVPSAGGATPRYLPPYAWSALITAFASSAAENPEAGVDETIACCVSVDDEIIDCWPEGVTAPDDEPGVDVAFGATEPAAGELIAG